MEPSPGENAIPAHQAGLRLLCRPMEGQPAATWLHMLYAEDDINARLQVLADLERTRQAEHRLNYLIHELSNYVTAIAGHTELILAGDGTNLTTRLQTIYHSADQCRAILLNSRKWMNSPRKTALLSIRQTIRRSLDMVQWALKDILVTVAVPDDIPRIRVNPTSIEQVLINLLTNAAYAARQTNSPPRILIEALSQQERITITVEDNGPGLPNGLEGRLFEPYFTTKPEGIGTGLGLVVARGLIKQMGGSLDLRNSEAGARAVIELPFDDKGP